MRRPLVLALPLAAAALLGAAPAAPSKPSAAPAAVNASKGALSDALKARRPAGGEYFGLYLMDKKVGYIFTDLKALPDGRALSVNEFVFKANVGTKVSERVMREERTYESRPGGRLLGFKVMQSGDGGEQVLEGSATPTGLRVLRKRPGLPNEVRNLPPTKETLEDADQARVALLRGQPVKGRIVDGQDLEQYGVSTTLEPAVERTLAGVKVRLSRAVTVSEKENVPVEVFVSGEGEVVEVNFGSTMRAVAEPESVAKRLDQVEVFGLTRIVLPRALPETARAIPGTVTLVMTGLPQKFQQNSYRQQYTQEPGGRVVVRTRAALPGPAAKAQLPVKDPEGGENLKSTLVVESSDPQIRALAKSIVGPEKDAQAAARRIITWVATNLEKDYGASADRATDVLRQKKGDCTEHSLLAVALLRAAGIPSRRVDGVVYLMNEDRVPALYWHEWVEAYVGEWTQMDPTFNQLVADATHFGVGQEGNAEITPLIGQLKVVEVR
ncbi:transglutaminase domain-containing protein [Aggregicoccus sp. 17bor-14]|uniref:transglutaminase-like domain-containing protein n=1 Tax=Myxococcaceae TaxID=31 RepID=UPI00129CDF81|nr:MULTISPECIES: transglutaminase-like domain-containing protein [Myxococcaceae]MBF5044553.1 transglutaminase domain-containing protein [Simulacricoccus sp. 17bor-14]MRI90298.1 transglutaminase domain-containing protein [Aggregicoccus sp. 17bor-14]